MGVEGLENTSAIVETTRNAANGDEQSPTPTPVRDASPGADPDRALKGAIVAAVEACLYDRARALLDVLVSRPAKADVGPLRKV